MNIPLFSCLVFFFVYCSSVIVQAEVPLSKTLAYVNEGALHSGLVEDSATYRPLKIANYPFSLCFYNTTRNAYFLGIGMGNANTTSFMRWVWSANPTRPVTDKAKLVFSRNGNLALIDTKNRFVWQTRTANKGAVDIKLLPNGNLVLLNKQGGFVWQSFDYPTHTLMIGQSLRPKSSRGNKLVNGAYSMVIDAHEVGLFFKSPHSPKPLLYFSLVVPEAHDGGALENVTLNIAPVSDGPDTLNEIRLEYADRYRGLHVWAQPKYNSTLSILRLSSDGNLHVYTYYEKGRMDAWEETYTEFISSMYAGECLLPEKCGSLGICENSQCVACPTPKGVTGWSKNCKPSKLPACNAAAANVSYYKIEGVNHFLHTNFEGLGPMKIGQCRKKCSEDCKCMAFFYRKDTFMCLLTNELNTLMKVHDSSSAEHIAYIKYAK
ncbi:hypothetical protein MKW94_011960 [Papaver nudicaule]|uniref:Bulb-type lectin domain-containing protein n=1 Tax=Papaver nudicaule TaxID=74823 RepID=A0AA41V377_PAPNU|nr:hypothetical protein [Papaver nudicaule]